MFSFKKDYNFVEDLLTDDIDGTELSHRVQQSGRRLRKRIRKLFTPIVKLERIMAIGEKRPVAIVYTAKGILNKKDHKLKKIKE